MIGTSQRVTVASWYAAAEHRLEEIRTDAGDVLQESAVEQLVQAMATLAPPEPGQLTLTQALRDQLAPVLAASWQHP